MDKILEFFNKFKAGEFGYSALKDAITKFDRTVAEHPDMSFIMDLLNSFASIIPYIMIASMLLIAFFGKKLLPFVKFISFFAVGFGLGVNFIHPLIVDVISLPAWLSGLLIGILAAIIYRLLYVLFFATFTFYGVFTICYSLLGTALDSFGDLKGFIFMAIAAVVMILAFVFRKYVEMLGTAALGGLVIAKLVANNIWDYTALEFLNGEAWIALLVVTVVIALPGFIVQVKTRRRY